MRLPEYLTRLSPVGETLAAMEAGEEALAAEVAERNAQLAVSTADTGLDLWEADYGLPVRAGGVIPDRRAAILAAMAGGRTLTPALLKELCVRLGGGERGEVEEDFPHWAVTALAVCRGRMPESSGALARAVERLKPAHLAVAVLPAAELETADGPALHGGALTIMTAEAPLRA